MFKSTMLAFFAAAIAFAGVVSALPQPQAAEGIDITRIVNAFEASTTPCAAQCKAVTDKFTTALAPLPAGDATPAQISGVYAELCPAIVSGTECVSCINGQGAVTAAAWTDIVGGCQAKDDGKVTGAFNKLSDAVTANGGALPGQSL
ncbi:hypothetical protein HK102_005262 [Quaeritorhiza haematococci]|nr:hypothetical protein HK102_005262 [Quaeritorhiza haematococci]